MSPPQTKKRKAVFPRLSTEDATKPVLLPDILISRKDVGSSRLGQHVPAERDYERFNSITTPFGDVDTRNTATPASRYASISQDLARHVVTPARRMLATPARHYARTIREQVYRPSPGASRVGSTPKSRLQKHASLTPSVISRTIPVGPSRSVSKVSVSTTPSFPAVALECTDSDSEDSSDEGFKISKPSIVRMGSSPPLLEHRAARKSMAQTARKTTSQEARETPKVEQSSEGEDDLYVDADPIEILNRLEQVHAEDSSVVPCGSSGERMYNELEEELTDILNALVIWELRVHEGGRYPFLRRNLRKAMDNLGPSNWKGHDPNAVRSHSVKNVEVHFILSEYESLGDSFSGKWLCPLCPNNLGFNTRGALDTHLYEYHTECTHEWSNIGEDSILLKIILPDIPETDSEMDTEKGLVSPDEGDLSSDDERLEPLHGRTPPSENKPFLRGSSVLRAQTTFLSSPSKMYPSILQVSPIQTFKTLTLPTDPAILRPARPIDPLNPERYPTPPPIDDLEGPAAVYPFILEDSYSARPGGPKLYDILNELSLEPFGLMAGYIIEREDDIFELDDTRDDDKVMLALWGRWIFLNRQRFTENYETGVKFFIDEYWRVIHRAAGFSALRTWLLVLVENRFLTGAQFCDVLSYYKDLVGMGKWK